MLMIGGGILLAAAMAGGGTLALRPMGGKMVTQPVLPAPVTLSNSWQGVDKFAKQEKKAQPIAPVQGSAEAKKLAAIRAQLFLAPLPSPVANIKRDKFIADKKAAETAAATSASPVENRRTEQANTLISNKAQETLNTLEALKAALKSVKAPDVTTQAYKD